MQSFLCLFIGYLAAGPTINFNAPRISHILHVHGTLYEPATTMHQLTKKYVPKTEISDKYTIQYGEAERGLLVKSPQLSLSSLRQDIGNQLQSYPPGATTNKLGAMIQQTCAY